MVEEAWAVIDNTKGEYMNHSLITKIGDILRKKQLVYFSERRIDYDPECKFFSHANYEILARQLYMGFGKRKLNKKDFLKKFSKGIYDWFKDIDMPNNLVKFKSKNATNKLWKLTRGGVQPLSNDEMTKIKAELTQKFRKHCCSELDCTDNASRRYFFRSPIVYIRELNTYVLTNCRKYIYNQEKDEYRLDNAIKYEILDYCPFCGEDLRCLRVPNSNEDEIIKAAINKWRDAGEELWDDDESYITQMTFYGINCYDSFYFISSILASKYSHFDGDYGVDETGVMHPGAKFITVEKMFKLADKYDLLKYFDADPLMIDAREIPEYFHKKFTEKNGFSNDDVMVLTQALQDIFWTMYHQPKYFDELLENDL